MNLDKMTKIDVKSLQIQYWKKLIGYKQSKEFTKLNSAKVRQSLTGF